jgi:hypothetical protein
MQRFVLIHQDEDPRDQFLSFEIGEAAQVRGSEMRVFVGIAFWTTQWTFAGDLNRKRRSSSS